MLEKSNPEDVWPSEIVAAARILEQEEHNLTVVLKGEKGNTSSPTAVEAFKARNNAYQRVLRLCRARPAVTPKKYVGAGSR
jgi:NAD(P)H-hydrate repair Nnr-like enzyme with NAD(P)H-hydrate epimerase domain